METSDTRDYDPTITSISIPIPSENLSCSLIPFKEKMKNLYILEQTATNEFDKLIFKMMNENFRKYGAMILNLVKLGHIRIK
jgi:hypothetical protein